MKNTLILLPGIAFCVAITLVAYVLQIIEQRALGHPYVEALVLAILLGTAIRTAMGERPILRPGIAFSAKMLLEIAVVLLGASLSLRLVAAAGPALLLGVVIIVVVALTASYLICRVLSLPPRLSLLVASGNSICGNSAIAAVAPVIGASGEDIASSIAFTAILGVAVVLGLPLLIGVLRLSDYQYGVLAGLTVYAVPQVLAATLQVGLLSTQIGTLVKLVRVLMLGPLVLVLSIGAARLAGQGGKKPGLTRLVPWFIVGFLVLAAVRSIGLVPDTAVGPIAAAATLLTVVSMAALGLGVDLQVLGKVGGRVTAAVVASLVLLLGMSFALIRVLRIS